MLCIFLSRRFYKKTFHLTLKKFNKIKLKPRSHLSDPKLKLYNTLLSE